MNNVTCFGRLLFISMINSQDLESEQFYLFWQFNVIVNTFKDKYSELIDLFWLCFIHLINSKNLHWLWIIWPFLGQALGSLAPWPRESVPSGMAVWSQSPSKLSRMRTLVPRKRWGSLNSVWIHAQNEDCLFIQCCLPCLFQMLKEARFMMNLNHKHIIRMIGQLIIKNFI